VVTRTLIAALALASAAHADTSIAMPAAPADFDPKKCSMRDAPYYRVPTADRALPSAYAQMIYADLKQAGRNHYLYTASSPRRSMAIDRRTKREVAAIPVENAALVEDERGELVGLLELRRDDRLSLWVHGEQRWLSPPPSRKELFAADSATTLVAGKLLVVALYHRISTGAILTAFDLETGRFAWSAHVAQMHVSHSKYFNDVSLSRGGDVIFLRGYEAVGCYEQTFDLASGRRLSSTIP
jgi:hypothetical protein